MLKRITCGRSARGLVVSTMLATLVAQGVLSVSHSHAVNPHDTHDVANHEHGDCGHSPDQSHSDTHGDECTVCAAVLLKSSRPDLPIDLSVYFVLSIYAERPVDVEHDKSHEIGIGSICLRGPPTA